MIRCIHGLQFCFQADESSSELVLSDCFSKHMWYDHYKCVPVQRCTLQDKENKVMSQEQSVPSPISRRRFLQYSGAAAMGGSLLAACAGTGGGTASGGGSSNVPALTQWYHQYGEAGTHEAVLKYAKAYTKANVTVSWVPGTGNEYPNK